MPAHSSADLDSFDLAILDILQRDNTIAQREIARQVHLSAPAVQRRIKRLRESGVIRAEVAVLDPTRLGRPLTLTVEVHLHDENPEHTAGMRERIRAEPAVRSSGHANAPLLLEQWGTLVHHQEPFAQPSCARRCRHACSLQ